LIWPRILAPLEEPIGSNARTVERFERYGMNANVRPIWDPVAWWPGRSWPVIWCIVAGRTLRRSFTSRFLLCWCYFRFIAWWIVEPLWTLITQKHLLLMFKPPKEVWTPKSVSATVRTSFRKAGAVYWRIEDLCTEKPNAWTSNTGLFWATLPKRNFLRKAALMTRDA